MKPVQIIAPAKAYTSTSGGDEQAAHRGDHARRGARTHVGQRRTQDVAAIERKARQQIEDAKNAG